MTNLRLIDDIRCPKCGEDRGIEDIPTGATAQYFCSTCSHHWTKLDGADVVSGLFHVQVKLRRSLPQWLWDWLGGIVGDAAPHKKIGVLVLKKPRQRDAEGLVVLRYGDFVDLVGRIDVEGEV